MQVLVIHGPNLNMLGKREPEIYGTTTLAQIDERLRRRGLELGCIVSTFQSNHEGALIDHLQAHADGADGIVINPGALSHYSYALYDALRATGKPVVEVHLTNPQARPEVWRHHSVTAAAARTVIAGEGPAGYERALELLAREGE
jgi:3-dehydroquinate dehydratase-2